MKVQWKENAFLLDGMESALPESYEVKVLDIEKSNDVASSISQIKDVEKVVYYKDIVDKITKISQIVKYVGLSLVGGFIIGKFLYNDYNNKTYGYCKKKRNQHKKKYIGATNASITGPFIVEGMILGLLGARFLLE